jgi:hypothetical protein
MALNFSGCVAHNDHLPGVPSGAMGDVTLGGDAVTVHYWTVALAKAGRGMNTIQARLLVATHCKLARCLFIVGSLLERRRLRDSGI